MGKTAIEASLTSGIPHIPDKTRGKISVVVQRFPRLATHLPSLYAGYYVAELLNDGTQENDPHPHLFDRALELLRELADALRAELGWAAQDRETEVVDDRY